MSLRLEDPAAFTPRERMAELCAILAAGLNRIGQPSGLNHSMQIVPEPSAFGLELSDRPCPDGGTVNGQRKDKP